MGSVGSQIKKDIDKIKDWLKGESKSRKKAKPKDLSKIKDKTLEGIERRIRNLKQEELYAFDANDNLVAGYQGDQTSVAFPSTLLDMEDATVTHGHPKGMEEFGGTFSFADINNMLNSKWKEHRATASGQGEMNYIMRKTKNADAKGLRDQINKDYPKLNKEWQDAYTQAYKDRIKAGAKPAQARHEARQIGVGMLNAYYKRTFKKYGYEYVTRKKDYKYNR